MRSRRALRVSPLLLSLGLVASLVSIRSATGGGISLSPFTAQASRATVADISALPLAFEVNRGQTDTRVRFLARSHGATLFLTAREAVLALPVGKGRETSVRLHPRGAFKARPVGENKLVGRVSYFLGAHRWTNIPTYARVLYPNVYPHTDLAYYGRAGQLEYDWVLHPGARPAAIKMQIDGAGAIGIGRDGSLLIRDSRKVLRQAPPLVYQMVGGRRVRVAGQYVLSQRNIVGFSVGRFDASRSLVIDPVLTYRTYVGGTGNDVGRGIAVDGAGNAYITGYTASTSAFPLVRAKQSTYGGGSNDAFITELSPDGKTFLYSTYLGGTGDDEGMGIAADRAGDAYVTGFTNSPTFPTDTSSVATKGGYDIFMAKLDPTGGTLLYSGVIGGAGDDRGTGIAVDSAGHAFISAQVANGATGNDAAMFSLQTNGQLAGQFVYGGPGDDGATAIALDGSGNVWETGLTGAAGFLTGGTPLQNSFQGGTYDAFVTEITAPLTNTAAIAYSTYLGSPGDDHGTGIAVDSANNVYVTGYTNGTTFPTQNPIQNANAGGYDAFITKFTTSSGVSLSWSTYYGGNGDDFGQGIAVTGPGQVVVTGYTSSNNLTTPNAIQSTNGGGANDAFVLKTNTAQTGLAYATYLGGSGDDRGYGVATDTTGNVYVAGETTSGSFVTAGAAQTTLSGGTDAFAAMISDTAPGATATPTNTSTPVPPTSTGTITATATATVTPTSTPTRTPSGIPPPPPPGGNPTATSTPTSTATPVPTNTPTPVPTATNTPTATPVPAPEQPVVDLNPTSPTAGQNLKVLVATSPGASVKVTIQVKIKVRQNRKTVVKTLYRLVLTGRAKASDGRFGRTRRIKFFPSKPTTATITVKVTTAGGSASKTKSFIIRPAKTK